MRLLELSDATTFLNRSHTFLLQAEAENNLLLSSALTLARSSATRSPKLSFFVIESAGSVVCAALYSAERRLLLSTASPEAAAFFASEFPSRKVQAKTIFGPSRVAQAFRTQLASVSPQRFTNRGQNRVMKLTALKKPTQAPGIARVAKEKDLRLLIKWSQQFVSECDMDESPAESEEVVRRYIAGRQLFIWEDNGPVAMAGYCGQTPNGVRLIMVYTEPSRRSRGYAASLVHTLSHKLLSSGHKSCFLFVDAANPAANHIYEKLGYQFVEDFSEFRSLE